MEIAGQLPFKVEYSKSGRAGCKKCKEKIDKDVVRVARMMKSRHHDGVDPNWFHFDCFFGVAKKWGLNSGETAKIGCLNDLRIEDQERVEKGWLSFFTEYLKLKIFLIETFPCPHNFLKILEF